MATVSVDPITTEVIRNSLLYAAEEMGLAVRNSSFSPNIKERLDHSCALFDAQARLIAQAEHIPVHLGSLPWGVRTVLADMARHGIAMEPGDMVVVNNPHLSGTHLNDITLIRPIFWQSQIVGYATNKAHHQDVGGRVPGSLSPDSSEIYQEGVILPPMKLLRGDEVDRALERLICESTRTPEVCAGDLRAQVAGNFTGERRLIEVVERYGFETYLAAIEQILDESEVRLRQEIARIPAGVYAAEDFLESPQPDEPPIRLAVAIAVGGDGSMVVDYTGTAEQVRSSVNAVYGVTLSGVYYVVRAVTDPTIPMNDGCLRPIRVHVPEGTVLNPRWPAAVGAGNVETSTRNADVLFRALAPALPDRVPAASGGTMSNVMVGGAGWAFYETIACGMGGRPGLDGIDGIHCNMTNTRNTPVEAIERYLPLQVLRYEFRSGTGGAGRWRGGCGVERAFRLLAPAATLSILAERAVRAPWGLADGLPGARSEHYLTRDGGQSRLPAKVSTELRAGDEVRICTPGGGGWGAPAERSSEAIARDLAAGLLTPEDAARLYGFPERP